MSDEMLKWAPTTFSMGFLGATIDRVAVGLTTWVREQLDGQEPRTSQLTTEFPEILASLQPLTMLSRRRELLVATYGEWTAYFDNLARGTDASNAVAYLCRVLACRGVAIRNQPHTIGAPGVKRGTAGATVFEVFGPAATDFLNYVRSVAVVHDGRRWTFIEVGKRMEFERLERYRQLSKRNRFTPELLVEYCRALGIRPYDADFFKSRGVLVDRPGDPPETDLELTLSQARLWLELEAE